MKGYIELKDKKVSVIIRNYRNSNRLKMYFNGNILNISKPVYFSHRDLINMIKENEDSLYEEYMKIISIDNKKMKHWYDGEKILYEGEYYTLKTNKTEKDRFNLIINKKEKIFEVTIPNLAENEERKEYIDYMVKKLFKNNTEVMLKEKLPYWEKVTGIRYKEFKVRDTISKYGSCKPHTKQLYFSSRLIMLPQDKVDAIIVHELAHIIHHNHSEKFYGLVKKYVPNYKEIDIWLKENINEILI